MTRAPPSPQWVATVVPFCPDCRGKSYRYVVDDTVPECGLRSLDCEGCGADILETYFNAVGKDISAGEKDSAEFLLVISSALLLLLILIAALHI